MGKGMNGVVPEQFEPPATMEARIATLPHPSPEQVEEHLESLGFRGQEGARRAVALLSYRHGLRLRRRFLEGVPSSRLLAREACLLNGPTGTGKTHLLNLLRDEVLDVPTVVVDLAQLSECTDVDQAISWVVSWLVDAAGGDRTWASCGVICLDGLDRVRCHASGEVASGPALEWARRHWRVQQALLTLLTSRSVTCVRQRGPWRASRPTLFSLQNVSIIACGSLGESRNGLLPELVRQFTSTARLAPLGRDELQAIMGDTIRWYRRELGPEVDFAPPAERQAQILEAALHGGGVHELLSSLGSLLDEFTQEWTEGANG